MYCEKCGNEITNDDQFCGVCGIPLKNIQKSKKNKRIDKDFNFIIRIVIIFVILGLFGSYGGNKATEYNDKGIEYADKTDNYEDAINSFKQASENYTDDESKTISLINLALTYEADENNEMALKTYEEALQYAKDESYSYFIIKGGIYELKHNYNLALQSYNKAYNINPDEYQINSILGVYYSDMDEIGHKDYNKSLKYSKRAYELEPASDLSKENLAVAYYLLENYDKALSLFLETNYKEKGLNNYWLGLIYVMKEDDVHAKYYFKKASDMGIDLEPEIRDYLNNNYIDY
ncbi:MAG: tetratricopeptide repeat protein [Candidatus Andersenbacteria bacterium]|nr:tetratricopeptide repeat protein [Candidatus Andersenbacteria bacterium]